MNSINGINDVICKTEEQIAEVFSEFIVTGNVIYEQLDISKYHEKPTKVVEKELFKT